VSAAADFAQPETKEITLPAQQNGKAVAVLICAVPVLKLIQALDGIPEISTPDAGDKTFQRVREIVSEQDGPMRRIAAAGVVSPKFAFNGQPAEGEADWDNVRFENQKFIVSEIMDFSGFSKPAEAPVKTAAEAAAQAGDFRGVATP
jgi:hypothetical protein